MADEAVEEKIQRLQAIEETLHGYLAQKQRLQSELVEFESGSAALEGAKRAYRIIGNLMVEQPPERVAEYVRERMGQLKVRLCAIERQEERLKGKAESLQREIMRQVKKE